MEIHKVSQVRLRKVEPSNSPTQSLSENEKIQKWTNLLKEMPDIRDDICLKESSEIKTLASRLTEEFFDSQS